MDPTLEATEADYEGALERALPRGIVWRAWLKSGLRQFLQGFAPELVRVHSFVSNGWREVFPGTAVQLLSVWERILGLPRPGAPAPTLLADRQKAAAAAVAARGGSSRTFLAGVAAALGATIDIRTPRVPFRADISKADDPAWDEFQVYVVEIEVLSPPMSVDERARFEAAFEVMRPEHAQFVYLYP